MICLKLNGFIKESKRVDLMDKLSREAGQPVMLFPNNIEPCQPNVLYKCGRRACETCHLECNHTTDISHAVNFEKTALGVVIEKEG